MALGHREVEEHLQVLPTGVVRDQHDPEIRLDVPDDEVVAASPGVQDAMEEDA